MCERCNGGYDRDKRIAAIRAERESKFEYVATYGAKGTTVVGATFTEVADVLVDKGYQMVTAKKIAELTIQVSHSKEGRAPAAIKKVLREDATL